MKQSTLFRSLILVGLAFSIIGSGLDFFVPSLVPTEITDAYDSYTDTQEPGLAWILTLGIGGLILIIVGIASTIGLLLFKPWSRRLALWLSVLSLLMYPLLGPVIYSGWAYMLLETSMVMWGAALAMAYFSELAVRFEPDRQHEPT